MPYPDDDLWEDEENDLDDEDDDDFEDDLEVDLDDDDEEFLTPEGTVEILARAIAEGEGFCRNGKILLPTGQMTCKVCGCTEHRACPGGCFWVVPNLCSKCSS
jgi:hypothetical protein